MKNKDFFYLQQEKIFIENRIFRQPWFENAPSPEELKRLTKEELESGIAWAWKEVYSWKNIIKRLDFSKWKTVKSIFMLVNIGYRKYAKEFKIFDAEVMSDNSDIPEVK